MKTVVEHNFVGGKQTALQFGKFSQSIRKHEEKIHWIYRTYLFKAFSSKTKSCGNP